MSLSDSNTFRDVYNIFFRHCEGVSVTTGNPAFCLALHLTGVHFRGELQYVRDFSKQKISVDQSDLEK